MWRSSTGVAMLVHRARCAARYSMLGDWSLNQRVGLVRVLNGAFRWVRYRYRVEANVEPETVCLHTGRDAKSRPTLAF